MDVPPAGAANAQSALSPSRFALGAIALATAILIAVAYWPTLVWLVGRWRTDPFYSHGPLVPLVAAALLWRRRRELRLDPSRSFPLLLVSAAALHLLGVRLMFEFLSCVSIILLLAGLARLAGGKELLRAASFPLLYLLFAIPLPTVVLQQVSLPLQLLSSAGAEAIFRALGASVGRHGVLLVFPGFTLAVADACSGLRSLITVLAIAALAAHLAPVSWARKLLLLAIGAVAAVIANLFRITLAGFVGLAVDGDAACIFFERYSGYFFFALVVLAMLAALGLVARKARAPEKAGAPPTAPVSVRLLAVRVLVPLFAVLVPTTAAAIGLRSARASASPARLAEWQPGAAGWEIQELRRPEAPRGEEWMAGTMKGPGDRTVGFTILHSVSGRYLHSPEACSLATGWIAERQDVRERSAAGGATLPLHLWILRRGSERVCLVFWFDLSGRPARGSVDQHVGAVWQRLVRGRIDSAYGEISMSLPIGKDLAAEEPLLDLACELHREVGERLWKER